MNDKQLLLKQVKENIKKILMKLQYVSTTVYLINMKTSKNI